jgi:hypothetical protein
VEERRKAVVALSPYRAYKEEARSMASVKAGVDAAAVIPVEVGQESAGKRGGQLQVDQGAVRTAVLQT